MRRYLKKEISNMLGVMSQACGILQNAMMSNQLGKVKVLMEDLSVSANEIITAIVDECEAGYLCKECLIAFVDSLHKCLGAKRPSEKVALCMTLKKRLLQVDEVLKNHIPNDRFQIVFMPYKADMWTSMESIWESAILDDECEVTVVPMPYYDIGNSKNVSFIYEGDRFPERVKCVHYEVYSESEKYPDVIVIHNPYDEMNTLTRVPERFYSSTLLNCTAKLVYSPYYTLALCNSVKTQGSMLAPANQNADIILCQSEQMKQAYEKLGYPCEKLITYGSPKIDSVINGKITKNDIPKEWKDKIKDKKVFLLNTHLGYFPQSVLNTGKTGDYAVRFHDEIIDTFLNRDDCVLIWRPHPMLKMMLRGKFPQCLEYVNTFEAKVREADNGIIDELGDYRYSFACSDALLSTWSSLINEYMVTKKPALIFQTRLMEEMEKNALINLNVNYFRFGAGGMTFEEFRDNVIAGIDPKYQLRIDEINKAFPNLEGQAGNRIYKYLKEH